MIIIIITIVILGTVVWAMSRSLPYPIPSGEFKVGTVILDLEDSSRTEWALPEKPQNRRFVTRVWYPAKPKGTETMLPIMEKPYSEGMQKLYGIPTGKERPSYSHINAPIHEGEKPFPILIFTHGAGSFMTQNLTSIEELASQGFIVMSLSFPYESVATVFSDGSVIRMNDIEEFKAGMNKLAKNKDFISKFARNTEAMKNSDPQMAMASSVALGEKYMQLYPNMKIWLDTRVEDVAYLINNLDNICIEKQKLITIADIDNIGLFGHSFGALTTLQFLMKKEFPAVKCGMALDVPYFNMDSTSDISLKAPILFMSSDYIKLSGSKVKLRGLNDFLKHYTNETLHEVNVKGAAHYNFSDMNYMPKFMTFTPLLGSISQKEAVKIMKFYLDVYFKGHLNGENLKKIEDSISSEVEFREIFE
jgi:Platelet-activating factor acetylhydrolase, isoform II